MKVKPVPIVRKKPTEKKPEEYKHEPFKYYGLKPEDEKDLAAVTHIYELNVWCEFYYMLIDAREYRATNAAYNNKLSACDTPAAEVHDENVSFARTELRTRRSEDIAAFLAKPENAPFIPYFTEAMKGFEDDKEN